MGAKYKKKGIKKRLQKNTVVVNICHKKVYVSTNYSLSLSHSLSHTHTHTL